MDYKFLEWAWIEDYDSRVEAAKTLAEDIYYKRNPTAGNSILFIQVLLAKHYNIPIFSDYFKERTVEELIFELEIINLFRLTPEDRTKELIEKAKKSTAEGDENELKSIFSDWEEERVKKLNYSKGLENNKEKDDDKVPDPDVQWITPDESGLNDDFIKDAKKFMETGEFKNDNDNDDKGDD